MGDDMYTKLHNDGETYFSYIMQEWYSRPRPRKKHNTFRKSSNYIWLKYDGCKFSS